MVKRDYEQNEEKKILLPVQHDNYGQVDKMSESIKGDRHKRNLKDVFLIHIF